MRTRITFGSAPGTGISRAHSSGTLDSPISRAATAGNSASRSGVSVKMQLTRSSAPSAMRAGLEATQAQRPEGDAFERLDGVADGLAHALDLSLAALVDRQLDPVGG